MMISNDWQSRTLMLIGDSGAARLKTAHVLVAGLGGVGAAAAEMLCRAGVGTMTIVDRDVVTATNRNRQIPALVSTEGKEKAAVMAKRLGDINPDVKLNVVKHFLKDEQTLALLEAAPYDYVVDAIDTLSPKIYLIYHCVQLGYPIVSSMGSGAKLDPSLVRAVDLSETYQCTFAYDIRKRLRKLGVEKGITAVFSPEPVIKGSIQHHEGERNKKSLIGTISYMPVVFGCHCAAVTIRDLLNKIRKIPTLLFALAFFGLVSCQKDELLPEPTYCTFTGWDTTIECNGLVLPNLEMTRSGIVETGNDERLRRLFAKMNRWEEIRIGFIGGSITAGVDATTPDNAYPQLLVNFLNKSFSGPSFSSIVNGYRSTGTYFGCCRVEDDILVHQPDLIIIEFCVNDQEQDFLRTQATMEGLLRKCLKTDAAVLIFMSEFHFGNPMIKNVHQTLGRYYGLPVIGMGAGIDSMLQFSSLTWQDLYSDDIHPNDRGHFVMASLMKHFLCDAFLTITPKDATPSIPAYLFSDRFENARVLKSTDIEDPDINNGWDTVIDGNSRIGFVPQYPNAVLEISNQWKECALVYSIGPDLIGKLEIAIDGVPVDTLCNLAPGLSSYTMPVIANEPAEFRTLRFRNLENDPFTIDYVLFAE